MKKEFFGLLCGCTLLPAFLHAQGILKEAQEYAAQIYGTKKCFFSVNGSTAALLAAVSASVNKGGKILVARNCHKAVYHALYWPTIWVGVM